MVKSLLICVVLFFSMFIQAQVIENEEFYSCSKESNLTIEDLGVIKSKPLKVGEQITSQPEESFDVSKYKGKTVVFMVSATWCGFCKYDIAKTMEWRAKSNWPKDDVVVIHMIVSSGRQDLVSAEAFVKKPMMSEEPLDLAGVDYYYSDSSDFNGFQEMPAASGELLFPGLAGTPYAIIFDKDGIARFRGHYTGRSDDHSAYYDEHYKFIGDVASGQCDGK